MTSTHTMYPRYGEACTSFCAYFQSIQNWFAGYRIISGFAVTRASSSSVAIAAGTFMEGAPATTTYAGATLSGVTAASASNHRYDLIYLDTTDNTVKRQVGTQAEPTSSGDFLENLTPQPPDLGAETDILLAVICVDENGIRSTDNGGTSPAYSVAGVADMRMKADIGTHLISYLSTPSEAQGDLIYRNGSGWTRLAAGTSGKYLKTGGAGYNPSWDYLDISALYDVSQARGDLITRGASSWERKAAGSANYYLMSQGAGADLTYSKLLVSSLYHASEARGCLATKNDTTWTVLTPGSAGTVLYSGGSSADLSWGFETIQLRFGAGSGLELISTGIAPGSYVQAKANYTIISWSLIESSASPISTSTVCDIIKKTSYPPGTGDSICASAKPTLSSATNATSSTLTGWTTAISTGDWLALEVESNTAGKCLNLDLLVQRR